jgi:hypothetical protein
LIKLSKSFFTLHPVVLNENTIVVLVNITQGNTAAATVIHAEKLHLQITSTGTGTRAMAIIKVDVIAQAKC